MILSRLATHKFRIALAITVYTIVLLTFGVFLTNRHVAPHVNVPSPTASSQ